MRARFGRLARLAFLEVWSLTVLLAFFARWVSYPISAGAWATVLGLHLLAIENVLAARYDLLLRAHIWLHVMGSVALTTLLYHFLGSTEVGIMSMTYLVVMLNLQILMSRVGYFFLANLMALTYGALLWAEHAGLLTLHRPIFGVPGPAWWPWFMAVGNWLGINLVAVHSTLFASVVERWSHDLAQANEQLEAKQKQFETLVFMLTHDLKNQAVNLRLSADLLMKSDGAALSPEGREELEAILRIAGHAERMILDLLGEVRITSTPEPWGYVDLCEVSARVVKDLEPQIVAKHVRVALESLPRVWGQAEKLGHVFGNLLSNAVKYVTPGLGEVRLGGAAENGWALVWVRDNGVGIPADCHQTIFGLFRRGPGQTVNGEAVNGTGVGLAGVKWIVEAHGGAVWVDSAPGRGATFYLRLPTGETKAGAAARWVG